MIRVFDAFSGIGGFRSAFERVGGFKTVGWCEIDKFAQKSYRALFDTGGNSFMRISELLTQQDLQTLISSLEDFRVSRSVVPERDLEQRTSEVLSSLNLPESLKPSGLAILSLRTYPYCWVYASYQQFQVGTSNLYIRIC